MEYILTEKGREKVTWFIKECAAKRKEILDAGIDTADDTNLPTEEDIVSDLNYGVGIDEDGDYYNCWGVTDNYSSDAPCCLEVGIDFMCTTFETLFEVFGFGEIDKCRQVLDEYQERKFVNNCFFIYENIGFTDTFGTPYTGETKYKKYTGMRFTVLGRVKEITEDKEHGADLECLPMWYIQFENGDIVAAYPEEICLAERE